MMKISIILSAGALLISSCTTSNEQQKAAPQSLPVGEISVAQATTYQEYPATLEGAVNVEIRPQVSGILEQIYVDEGDYVNKGQVLFRIDSRPFRQALANARASILSAEGSLVNARLEVEKLSPLVKNHVVSDYQLKEAKALAQIAEGNLAQAKAREGTALIDLGYTTIKAPVSGLIGRLPKKQGSIIATADTKALTTLSDVAHIRAYFSLAENDFENFRTQYPGSTLKDKLRKLDPVTLVLSNNADYSIPGKIDMIDGQFDQNTAAITLRATFANNDGFLRSGNTGKVRLGLVHQAAIEVPISATIELQDKVYVFAVGSGNKVSRQELIIAGKTGDKYLIKEGLKAGQWIVLSGADRLQEGTVINPKKTVKGSLAKNSSPSNI